MHFIGFIGIIVILALAFLLSNNRKAINYRTVGVGLLIQIILAVFILKTPVGKSVFGFLGKIVQKLLQFSDKGAEFIFGPLARDSQMQEVFGQNFIFFFPRDAYHHFHCGIGKNILPLRHFTVDYQTHCQRNALYNARERQ